MICHLTYLTFTFYCFFFFFFNDTATTEIYTLSLHDALPIFIATAQPERTAKITVNFSGSHLNVIEFCPESDKDRKSTRLNSSHVSISYAVFCLKKKKNPIHIHSY